MKIGVVGGRDIAKYSIANVVWEKITSATNHELVFRFFPIESKDELLQFYSMFSEDVDFLGFNVAVPWKEEIATLVGRTESHIGLTAMNTIYKTKEGIFSANTDVIGMEQVFKKFAGDLSHKKILILGAGGAGLSCAVYLTQKHDCKVYIHEINQQIIIPQEIVAVPNLNLSSQAGKFDIIINATPVGKYYLNHIPVKPESPISSDILAKIVHQDTVLVEMNYFPYRTEFLRLGEEKRLVVVSGIQMLVYQAVESMRLYTGVLLNEKEISQVANYIKGYVLTKEYELTR